MPVIRSAGRAVGTTVKGARVTARGGTRAGRWVWGKVSYLRTKGGAGELGMMRLLDLHAASCAGDTLVTMGLAGTVFFNVTPGAARGRVALYLLITMVPFAILAPIVGPLLDRFRHGRRYALAVTMLGRAFLAWLISDYINGIGLYPAAFGVLALSRAYGVARSAAVPRLLPPTLGLSEAGARASVFGTIAGAAVAPLGIAAFTIGPQWPLRVAAVVFIIGMVVALRLPPRADSDPPEVLPRVFQLPSRDSVKVLSGRLIVAVLSGSAALRAVYGFLTLFLAFSIRSGSLTTTLFGQHLSQTKALGFALGSLGVGSFIATAIGSRLRIHRPAMLQAAGIIIVAASALLATFAYSLASVIVLCFATSIVSGLAKLAVDASIQERIPEQVRASAFAHSETLLMLAWVAGGGLGLIPFGGRWGIGVCAVGATVAALRAAALALRLRKEKLSGSTVGETDASGYDDDPDTVDRQRAIGAGQPGWDGPSRGQTLTRRPGANDTTVDAQSTTRRQAAAGQGAARSDATRVDPATTGTRRLPVDGSGPRDQPRRGRWGRRRAASAATDGSTTSGGTTGGGTTDGNTTALTGEIIPSGSVAPGSVAPTRTVPRAEPDQPGYHLYRPSATGTSDTTPAE